MRMYFSLCRSGVEYSYENSVYLGDMMISIVGNGDHALESSSSRDISIVRHLVLRD